MLVALSSCVALSLSAVAPAVVPAPAKGMIMQAASQQVDSTRNEQVSITTPGGTVHGTLLLPPVAGKVPVVLLIAGSGPTDRDGNSPLLTGGPASLRLLAEALAHSGIASVRYDKRGVGASRSAIGDPRALRFDDYVSDAAEWLKQLGADPRFSRVVVAGHSEGALIGTIAAAQIPGVPVISIDGAGRRAPEVIHDQLLAAHMPVAIADSIMAELSAGRTVNSVPTPLLSLFSPVVQPYEISWFRYDPAVEIARLAAPVLIIQGANDAQVPVTDARRLADSAGANGRLVVIDSMTHVLKLAGPDPESQALTYHDPSIPIAPALVDAIVKFVRAPTAATAHRRTR